jgi:NAD+ synthetase
VLNASPYWQGKIQTTRELLERIANQTDRIVIWCNQVGGHDDIIFGGYSMVVSPRSIFSERFREYHGNIAMAEPFKEDRLFVTVTGEELKVLDNVEMNKYGGQWNPIINIQHKRVQPDDLETYFLFSALRLGLRDYCRRTSFDRIVFGSSGGIDSAVVGAIASITLGGENCTAITMPSQYSSEGSYKDSEELARRCKMRLKHQAISSIHDAVKQLILTGGKQKFHFPVTDENLQPRIRALLLMAESNDNGSLLLTTGNKSELAVGYCTIYGDMCGGYSLLTDVPKTWVYRLAEFINKYYDLIPQAIITKAPSAELAPDQKDTDSLPPYEKLDPIIDQILRHVPIECIKSSTDLPNKVVDRVYQLIEKAEYKRSQASIGPKVTERAFGSGRRIPIAKRITYV